jgi:coproporphyrinogen III oxidase-like Fe-S oxidoreductase
MKKVFLCFMLCFGFLSYASGCLCVSEITQTYNGIESKVEEYINSQKNAVNKLVDRIKKNTEDIKQQNEIIEKMIEAEKRKTLQNTEIVFLLKKVIELKTAGEM